MQPLLSAGNLLGHPVAGNVQRKRADDSFHGGGKSGENTGDKKRLDECMQSFSQYYETLGNSYMRERQKLIWDNRMIESRLAVAQQLQEMSRIMDMVAEDLYDISIADPQLMTELQKILRKRHIVVKQVWVMDKVEGRREIFLTMRARSGQCISVNEVAQLLSQEFELQWRQQEEEEL